jgi:hypothetical protein
MCSNLFESRLSLVSPEQTTVLTSYNWIGLVNERGRLHEVSASEAENGLIKLSSVGLETYYIGKKKSQGWNLEKKFSTTSSEVSDIVP